MRKSLALAVFVAGAMHGQLASALGVGDIATASTLNQPFKAFIPLRDAKGLEAAQLRVELADQQAFRNAGVDRTQFLNTLEFLVEVGGDGRGRIVVSTPQPVVEPYLDFIVEVRWPSGRMLREYTVLLDLPEFSASPVVAPTASTMSGAPSAINETDAPASATSATAFTQTAVSSDSAGARGPRPAAEQTALPTSGEDGAYRVQHHDTMWRIASILRPSPDVSTEQTMIAVLRKNPDAFIGNNVNRIKSGYVLQAPTEAEAKALNKQNALEEVRRQAREWRSGRISRSSSTSAPGSSQRPPQGPQLNATSAAEAKPQAEGAPDDVRFSIGSAGDSADRGEGDQLELRLQQEQEALEKAQLENAAMASRVREMEKQIDTLQKLIALKNRELATLQAGTADEGVANADALAASDADTAELANDTAADAESAADVAVNDSPVSGEKDVVIEAAAEKGAATAEPAPPAPASSSSAWYETPLYRYLAAGIALFLLLVLALRRRAKGEEPSEPSFDNLAAASDEAAAAVSPIAGAEGESEQGGGDALAADAISNFDFDSLDDSPVETGDEDIVAAIDSADEPVQAQTNDVISEAEIYVAYGRYDQAASLLKTAIEKEPENTELQCKLLDIYLDTRDRDNFLDAYRQLEASGDAAALAQVKESMSAIEGVSDWLDADAESASESDALDDLDEELAFLDEDDESGAPAEESFGVAEVSDEPTLDDAFNESADDADALDDGAPLLEGGAEPEAEAPSWSLDNAEPVAESGLEAEKSGDELADFELDLDSDFDLDSLDSLEGGAGAELLESFSDDGQAMSEVSADEAEAGSTGSDDEFELDDAFLASTGNEGGDDSFSLGSLEEDSVADAAESEVAVDEDELDLGDLDFNIDELSTADDAQIENASVESGSFELSDEADEVELSSDDFALPESTVFEAPESSLELSESKAADDTAVDESEPEALDLDSALAELDAEVEGLSFAEDDAADSEEQLVETLVDTADAEVDQDPAVSLGDSDSELDLNDLVFDEFSVDAMDEEGDAGLSDSDDVANKLDLARAFADMGDGDSARDLLTEVLESGDDAQKVEAQSLLDQLH